MKDLETTYGMSTKAQLENKVPAGLVRTGTDVFPLKCCCLQLESPSLQPKNSFSSICKAERLQEKGPRAFSDPEQLIALSLYIIFSREVGNITWYTFQEEEEDNKISIFQLGKEMVGLIFKFIYKAYGFNIEMNTSIPGGPWRQGKALFHCWRLQNTGRILWPGSLSASAGTCTSRALRIGPELHRRTGFQTHCNPQPLFTSLIYPQAHPEIVYILRRHLIQAVDFAMRIRHLNPPTDLCLGNPHSSSA